jgi:CheY-like chemotaxis protein
MAHTVLVIDDDPDVRFFVETALRRLGLSVVCACDGLEGIRRYHQIAPDLVITDIFMPNQEGLETIRAIRGHNAAAKIVAMSGRSRMSDADALQIAMKLGADKALAKPFGLEELRASVSSCLTLN